MTITAQREDREHKELMIRPSLTMHVGVDDFSFVLTNSGLGPAVIKDAAYRLDGKCIYPQNENARKFVQEDYLKVVRYIGVGFGSLVDSIKWKSDFKAAPSSRVAIPVPTQIIAVGEKLVVYKIGSEFASELHTKLQELGGSAYHDFADNFFTYALSMPLKVRYCSMSGLYCQTSISLPDETPCPLSN